ncbi:winged helix-turn-helix domain-containing protein [Acidisphaera sp. S103]|uniref:ATP-binding protein n=1 Tax=Acidisphaera sp. S103 TaxID=1747223 RepID=UPI00131E2F7D|nr:winged helix-turn-helix domain-containing protein [Acidisphaera sp. S103]
MPDENIWLAHASGDCEIDLARRELRVLGSPVPVGGRAFEIIELLARSAGELVTKSELMDRIWPGAVVTENTLHVHAAAVRKALGPNRRLLKTESGRGYRLLGDWTVRRHDATAPPVGLQRMRVDRESPVTHFPAAVTRLIGRTRAIARLRDLMSAYRVVTLTGPGGIGKTGLAMQAARGVVGEFPDGAWLVELASLSDPAVLPSMAANALRLPVGLERMSAEFVARGIGAQKLLLVLDNCEHVIAAAAEFAETLLRKCPNVTLLTTSREIFRIDGEHVYQVPPLDVPTRERHEPHYILEHSAVELFIARVKALDSNFSPHAENLPMIGAICRHLDGIPLAIEFAAARAATLGVRQVALSLGDRFALLTSGRRTAMPRQQTLRATLDWSHELLPEPERSLFHRLAIFSAGFTFDAVVAVMNDSDLGPSGVMNCVANLVIKSLVTLDNNGATFRWYLLETVRAYALEKLALHDQVNVVARRHAAFYRDLFAPHQSDLNMRLSNADLISRMREIDNVRAALDWSFSPVGDTDIGRDLTAAYAPVWLHRGLNSECRERCEHALLGLKPDTRQNMWRRMLLQVALGTVLYITEGMSERTQTMAAEALEFAEILDDLDTQVWALVTLAALTDTGRNYGTARTAVEQLRQTADRIGDPATVAAADRRMGYLQFLRGRLHEAQRSFERSLRFRFAVDDQHPTFWSFPAHHPSMSRILLAEMLLLRGFAERASNEAQASLDELNAADPHLSLHRVFTFGICRIAIMTGDLVTADREIARLTNLSTRLNAPFLQAMGRFLEGQVMVERGAFSEALSTLRGEFDVDGQTRQYFYDQEAKGTLAQAFAGVGRFGEALNAVDDAITNASQRDAQVWYLPELLRIKGEVLLLQAADRSGFTAEDCFNQAGEIARDQGALFWELRIALSLARFRVTQRREDEARVILLPVYERFTEGFATADLRAARTMLDALSRGAG